MDERERLTRGLLRPVRGAKLRDVEWKVRVMHLPFDRSIGLEANSKGGFYLARSGDLRQQRGQASLLLLSSTCVNRADKFKITFCYRWSSGSTIQVARYPRTFSHMLDLSRLVKPRQPDKVTRSALVATIRATWDFEHNAFQIVWPRATSRKQLLFLPPFKSSLQLNVSL